MSEKIWQIDKRVILELGWQRVDTFIGTWEQANERARSVLNQPEVYMTRFCEWGKVATAIILPTLLEDA